MVAKSKAAWRAWVRAVRTQAGISQAELGRRCSPPISAGRMSDIERGLKSPRDREVAAITEAICARRLGGADQADRGSSHAKGAG